MNGGQSKFLTWFVVMMAVAMLLLIFVQPQPTSTRITVSYTEFVQLLEDGKVESVTFRGDNVDGTLFNNLSDPYGEPTNRFSTRIPPLADTDLLPELRERGVEIEAEPSEEGEDPGVEFSNACLLQEAGDARILELRHHMLVLMFQLCVVAGTMVETPAVEHHAGGGECGVGKVDQKVDNQPHVCEALEDYAGPLRHVLRHDPDIIVVGEIRDRETADVAFQAAISGHKVFSTLHANDALTAVPKLARSETERAVAQKAAEAADERRKLEAALDANRRAADEARRAVDRAKRDGEQRLALARGETRGAKFTLSF